MAPRLLIVDDDRELTGLLSELLPQEGFDVETHNSGAGAAAKAAAGAFSLVTLDVMLPEANGFDILRELRRASRVPVILLTARGDDIDRIVGLEIGADDYIPKPFNPRELIARIRAVLRRTEPRVGESDRRAVRVDDVALDPRSRTVTRDDTTIELTTIEFDILHALLESAGHTISRETISEKVLERRFDPLDRSIDMHISKLRRKLGGRPGGEERIKTIRGVGYIYALPAAHR